MKAIIKVDIPEYQIGQEVLIYFKDTMQIKAICEKESEDLISKQALLSFIERIRSEGTGKKSLELIEDFIENTLN